MTKSRDGEAQDPFAEIERLLRAKNLEDQAERGLALCDELLAETPFERDAIRWGRLQDSISRFSLALGYDRSRLDLLRRSIEAAQLAQRVFTREADTAQWVRLQHTLARGLSYLGELAGEIALHRQSVAAFEEALNALAPTSLLERASMMNSLGSAHLRFGSAHQDAGLIAEAARHYEQALEIWKNLDLPDRGAMTAYNLGLCHATLAELSGASDHYDRAIDSYTTYRALTDRDNDPREWAKASNAIAMAFSDRGALAGDPAMIARAITEYKAILEVMTRDRYPAWWAMVTINLCRTEVRLGELENEPGLLVAAAERATEAIAVATERDIPTYWTALTNVRANARIRLGRRLGDARQLQQADDELTAVLARGLRTPADRAIAAHLRGEVRFLLGALKDDPLLFEAALADFDQALEERAQSTAPVPSAQTLIGRADAQRRLAVSRDDATMLASAITEYGEVLSKLNEIALLQRAAAARGRGEARLALWRLERSAVVASAAEHDFAEAQRLLNPALDPVAAIDIRRGRASAALAAGEHQRAAQIASSLLADAAGMLAAASMEHERLRLADALTGAGDVAAYAHALSGDIAKALTEHDRGRAHRLRGRLRLSEVALDGASRTTLEETRGALERTRRMLAEALEAGRPAAAIARLTELLDERQAAFLTVARHAGLGDDEDVETGIMALLTLESGTIVVPVVTAAGGLAIVLSAGHSSVLTLPDLTDRALDDILKDTRDGGWLRAYRQFRNSLAGRGGGDPGAVAAWNSAVEKTLEQTWRLLMEPLDLHLQALGLTPESEIVLVPGGRLAMLPLHASGTAQRRFIDRWSVVYAPSLTARLGCLRRVSARSGGAKRLLAVTDPRGDLGVSSNPAIHCFPPDQIKAFAGDTARRAAVLEALPLCSHASFFTHAWWDPDHPERSHIQLAGDEKIEARDFSNLNLDHSRMVVLGACESGVPGTRVAPDEFQGLPASLIEAGVPGVVATLWPVFNRAAERVLAEFFAAHIRDGLSPPAALRRAQLALRDAARTGSTQDEEATMVALGLRPRSASVGIRKAYDLSQPMFWAAFAYNGA